MIFTETAANRQPTFIPDDIKSRILCFGDSLTGAMIQRVLVTGCHTVGPFLFRPRWAPASLSSKRASAEGILPPMTFPRARRTGSSISSRAWRAILLSTW